MKVDVYYNQRLDRFSVLERATRRVWGYFGEIWLCDVEFVTTSRRPVLRAQAFYPTVRLTKWLKRQGVQVSHDSAVQVESLVRCIIVNGQPQYYSFEPS